MTRVLITGGRILDPSNRLDAAFDLLIDDGRIERIAPKLADAISPES